MSAQARLAPNPPVRRKRRDKPKDPERLCANPRCTRLVRRHRYCSRDCYWQHRRGPASESALEAM